MPKLTLSEAIAFMEAWKPHCSTKAEPMLCMLLAAAKAFACEECDGTGKAWGPTHLGICPACAEFRRVAREGVEG